jgi:trans-aconitate 2-methyltransferase
MLRTPPLIRHIRCLQHQSIPVPSFTRTMSSSSDTPTNPNNKQKDWSANQYLKFNTQRTRPVHDLIAQIKPHITGPSPRIYDLGCGPGNSTSALLTAFPDAKITGMDSSPDMLKKASATLPDVEFIQEDLATFRPSDQPDLLFSNAVFHWLRSPTRIPTLVRLFKTLKPGGVLAIQVPDNYFEPSHASMRDAAAMQSQPWSRYFAETQEGKANYDNRPELDRIESPMEIYDALMPHASDVDVWKTKYNHVLDDAKAIVEWVKGTGLQPFLNLIEEEEAKKAYLANYEQRLKEKYVKLVDGKVMLGYPRLFVIAVRR